VKNNKPYIPFVQGLISCIFEWKVSRSFDTWKDEFWMVAYFTGGVWSCILMAKGPMIKEDQLKVAGS